MRTKVTSGLVSALEPHANLTRFPRLPRFVRSVDGLDMNDPGTTADWTVLGVDLRAAPARVDVDFFGFPTKRARGLRGSRG
jgi:hypothetical protein